MRPKGSKDGKDSKENPPRREVVVKIEENVVQQQDNPRRSERNERSSHQEPEPPREPENNASDFIEKKTGKWTQEEREQFDHLHKTYGRDWVRMSEFILTRTPEQIRSHAQKYLTKKQKYQEEQRVRNQALARIERGEGKPVRNRKETKLLYDSNYVTSKTGFRGQGNKKKTTKKNRKNKKQEKSKKSNKPPSKTKPIAK